MVVAMCRDIWASQRPLDICIIPRLAGPTRTSDYFRSLYFNYLESKKQEIFGVVTKREEKRQGKQDMKELIDTMGNVVTLKSHQGQCNIVKYVYIVVKVTCL